MFYLNALTTKSMNTIFYVLSSLLFFTAPFLFFVFIYKAIDKRARTILDLLPGNVEKKFTDVRIWFKGYDMSKRVNKFQIDPFKSLYSYNLIDLYVLNGGLVIVGKKKMFGKTWLLSPFAICWPGGDTQLSMVPNRVRYVSAEVAGEDIDIKFHDQDYSNAIVIAIKKIGKDLIPSPASR